MLAGFCRFCCGTQNAIDGLSARPATESSSHSGRLQHCIGRHFRLNLDLLPRRYIPLRQSPRQVLLRTPLRHTVRHLLLNLHLSFAFAFAPAVVVTNLSR